MREVLPARHLDQALVTGAEFFNQYVCQAMAREASGLIL